MKYLIALGLMCLSQFSFAQASARGLETCERGMKISDITPLSTTVAKEVFSVASSSGTRQAARRWVCLQNLDSTAANHVWVSSFQVTATVGGVLDTGRSFPIPGGNTADARFCLPLGPNVKIWLHRVIGTASVAALSCE
jgi:hypothetical protein